MEAHHHEPTLNEVLESHGLRHQPAAHGTRHDILRGDRVVLHGVSPHEVWEWLRTEAVVCPDCHQAECAEDLGEFESQDLGRRVGFLECESCGWSWAPEEEEEWHRRSQQADAVDAAEFAEEVTR